MVNTDRTIIGIGPEHADGVWPLSIEAGWNQNLQDWRFMLANGRGYGLRSQGRWQASSLVLPLGPKLCWISMVLVTHELRRVGVGTGLLKKCIADVQSLGAVAGLDATEQGRPIYLPLGFRDLYRISRWHLDKVSGEAIAVPEGVHLRQFVPSDMASLEDYDEKHSAMERSALLAHLGARLPSIAWVAEDRSGKLVGYVLGREGRTASSIGPLIADSEEIGLALLCRAARSVAPPFIVDVPDAHVTIRLWLTKQGAVSPRGYMRMTLGEMPGLADSSRVFALAGPELG
jgi:GNAT superfamily N-acetyltransferase